MTNTITMWGNATGYGGFSGSESFVLNGYLNNVLLDGADDTVTLSSGGDDRIDLNWCGYTHSATDVIDLGQGLLDNIVASHDLYGATLSIGQGYGVTNVTLANHGGSTTLSLGNQGASVNQWGLGVNDNITLNGDAMNNVSFTSGMGADIAIGTAGDGLGYYTSTVSLYGLYNQLVGGDETFTVGGSAGFNQVVLGNGDDSVALAGSYNDVTLGNGNSNVTFANGHNVLHAGTGNNTVNVGGGGNKLYFGAGGAGSTETVNFNASGNGVFGGDENFIIANNASDANVRLGNGNNNVSIGHGFLVLGSSVHNTASNHADMALGHNHVILNGGVDQLTLQDSNIGADTVVLNGTMLGTQLSAAGNFDSLLFRADANAAVSEASGAQGLNLTFDGDGTHGMGDVSISGMALDQQAHITLAGMSSYYITVDDTQAGGLTLNFVHGSIDLIGVQSISNSLITVVPGH